MTTQIEKVKAKLDTHEAVCSERWLEIISRVKRLETIFIAFSGTIMVMLATMLIKQL
jgi:predicted nucleic acid-binding Zn ribbon protein